MLGIEGGHEMRMTRFLTVMIGDVGAQGLSSVRIDDVCRVVTEDALETK